MYLPPTGTAKSNITNGVTLQNRSLKTSLRSLQI